MTTRLLPPLPKVDAREGFPRNVTTVPVPLHPCERAHGSERPRITPVMLVPAQDFHKAKSLSLTTQSDAEILLSKLKEEKQELHEQSLQRVKSWTNTILGQRVKRLAFQAEKDRLAEADRLRIDDEWGVLQAKERKDRVERARLMQYKATPMMRQLNEKLNMSNVLHERELQIEHKKNLDALLKSHEYDETEALKRDRAALLKEMVKEELDHRNRKRTACEQRDQAKAKFTGLLLEREAEKDFQNAVIQKVAQEALEEKTRLDALRKSQRKAMIDGLRKNIDDKKCAQAEIQALDDDLDYVNDQHYQMQSSIAANKTLFKLGKRGQLDKVFDKVAAINAQLNKSKEDKMADLYHKLEVAHDGVEERREAEELRKKNERVQEINDYRRLLFQSKELDGVQLKIEGMKDRKQAEQDKLDFEQSIRQDQMKRSLKLRNLQKDHLTQMRETNERKVKRDAEVRSLEIAMNQAMLDDNERFEKFAYEAVEEFQKAGKNVKPIIRGVLRKSQPFPISPYHQGLNVKTYERLGFTCRYIPTQSVLMNPWDRATKANRVVDQRQH
ncbi:hypothetical protein BJ741DRAFT_264904 [Chytriomyces cf. hyalinus JEL632]|nr:hypothetical protein BJ741DRAFT_264904 [Chytriomyces cf. hyalinus JEL632]